MDKNDVIETEVLESDETFDFPSVFQGIYDDFVALDYKVSDDIDQRMKALLQHTFEDLDAHTYMNVMALEGMKYDQSGQTNAARYCAMRMLWIHECYTNRKKKRPRFLILNEFQMDMKMEEFLNKYTDFLEGTYAIIDRKLKMITIGMFLIVFVILALFLKFGVFASLLVSSILGLLNYIMQKVRLKDLFQKNQTKAIESYVEEDVLEFDRPVRYS